MINASPFAPIGAAAMQLPNQTAPIWKVDGVRAALVAHELGDFSRSSLLSDHILRDPEIRNQFDTRILAMLGLPMEVKKSLVGDQRQAQAVANDVAEWWPRRFRKRHLARFIRWRLMMGLAPGELPKTERDDKWIPSLKIWHPQHLRWNEAFKGYQMNTLDKGTVRFTPGDGRWVLFGGTEWDERPWMEGLVRSLAVPWVIKVAALNSFSRAVELYGLGIRKAKTPARVSNKDVIKRFFRAVKNLGRDPVIALPEGFDVDVAMTEANKGEGFQRLIDYCDRSFAVAVNGSTLTTHGSPGSYKQAEGGQAKELDRVEADAEDFADFIEDQVLMPYAKENYGSEDLAPRTCYDPAPPADNAKRSNILSQVSTAVRALREGVTGPLVTVNEARAIIVRFAGVEDLDKLKGGDENPLDEEEEEETTPEPGEQKPGGVSPASPPGGTPPAAPPPDPDQQRAPPPPGG